MPTSPTNTTNHTGQDKETALLEASERTRFSMIRRWLTGFRRWLSASTFAPAWLPPPLRHPVIGYLVALALQLLTVVINLFVSSADPLLPHYLPFALVVVVVGLYWGVGPSIVATFAGALLLYFGVFLLGFSWTLHNQLSLVGPTLYLLTGLIISALASQKERARHRAERLMHEAQQARQAADDLAASLTQEQAASDLERSRLHTILHVLPVGVVMADATGQIVEMNPMARAIWGQAAPRVGIEQYGAYKAWWPATSQRITADEWAMARALRTGEASLGEELLIEAFDGQQKTIINSAVPIRNEIGAMVGTVAALMDISERKRLEEALRQAERGSAAHASQLEALFESIVDGVVVYDREGHILRMNAAAMDLFGYMDTSLSAVERFHRYQPRQEQGQPYSLEAWPLFRVLSGEVLAGATTVDQIFTNPQGHEVEVNISGTPIRAADGHIVGGITTFRDVTERRRLERRTHEAFEALLAMAEALVQAPNEQATPEESGPATTLAAHRLAELTSNVLGCPRISISTLDLQQGVSSPLAVLGLPPEEERQWWTGQRYSAHWITGSPPEMLIRLQAGETLVLDTSQPPLVGQPNPYQAHLFLAVPMRIGERLVGLLIVDPASTTHQYTPEELALAEAAAKLGALVIERGRLLREREEALTNALALRQANRQMDAFLGMASHELKTPLTTIMLGLQVTRRRLETLVRSEADMTETLSKQIASLLDHLANTDRQATRLNRLVNDLLDVSRIQANRLELRLEEADLATIVREVVQAHRQADPWRTITLCLPMDQRVTVCVDVDRIGQVVTNYLTNALKYSVEERPVAVGLAVDGNLARVWVRDEGTGIPAEQHAQIWERFHRVPGVEVQSGSGVGLGLGLHISRTIIEQHHGQVGVESVPGQGSTFWFTVPVGSSPAEEHQ